MPGADRGSFPRMLGGRREASPPRHWTPSDHCSRRGLRRAPSPWLQETPFAPWSNYPLRRPAPSTAADDGAIGHPPRSMHHYLTQYPGVPSLSGGPNRRGTSTGSLKTGPKDPRYQRDQLRLSLLSFSVNDFSSTRSPNQLSMDSWSVRSREMQWMNFTDSTIQGPHPNPSSDHPPRNIVSRGTSSKHESRASVITYPQDMHIVNILWITKSPAVAHAQATCESGTQ